MENDLDYILYAKALTTNSKIVVVSQEDSWNHWLIRAPNMQSSNHCSGPWKPEPHDECWLAPGQKM